MKDFWRQVGDGSLTGCHIQALLEHRDPFAGPSMELCDQLTRWQKRFDEAGITCDTSNVKIPKQPPGLNRLIINPQGLMLNKQVEILRTKFKMCIYVYDLDRMIEHNDRSNEEGAYAIWVRDNVEADEEYKSLSANDISAKKIIGQTLLERLLHEWAYFDETGKHLDVKNVTLCTGSRHSDGLVPRVFWHSVDREVLVGWYRPDDSGEGLRIRAVVS
jgi:hypothetical protein